MVRKMNKQRSSKRADDKKAKTKHQESKDKKKQGSKQGAKKGEAATVAKYMYFAKHTLAPYPDEDGSALYVGDHEDEAALLDPAAVLRSRNANNCEMLTRPGMGLSLSAASIDVGFRALRKPAALGKLKTVLKTEAGEALRKACATLNIGKNGKAKRSEVEKAVGDYIDAMTSATNTELNEALVEVASFSSKVYLAVMAMLEHKALFERRKAWAKKMRALDQQPESVRLWAKDPTMFDKLKAALVDAFMQKMKARLRKADGAKSGKKRKTSKGESQEDESEDLEADEESSDDDDDDAKSDSKKNKKKVDSSSEDEDEDKKKADSSESAEADEADDDSSSSSSSAPKKKKPKAKASDKKKPKKDGDDDDKKAKKDGATAAEKKDAKAGSGKPKPKSAAAAPDGSAAKKAKKMDGSKKDGEPIHFTEWPIGDVQMLAGQLMTLQTAIGVTPGGVCPTPEIRVWYEAIPAAVREAEGYMAAEVETALGDGDQISNLHARQAIAAMLSVATRAEQWHESHSGDGAAGSSK